MMVSSLARLVYEKIDLEDLKAPMERLHQTLLFDSSKIVAFLGKVYIY